MTMIDEDKTAVRILAYHGIGEESAPETLINFTQFKNHMDTLRAENYNVLALPDVISAFEKKADLPKKSVVLTFDGSEKTIATHIAPFLKSYQFPYSVFLSPDKIKDNNPLYLNNKDLKRLKKQQLISFGIQPKTINGQADVGAIRQELNKSNAFYRKHFKTSPDYLAFNDGAYSQQDLEVLNNYDFKATLGQHSAVAYENKRGLILPRFTIADGFINQLQFERVINALPLPAQSITSNLTSADLTARTIGFTTSEKLSLKKLYCSATGQENPVVEKLGSRIEIRLKESIQSARFRVNCILPVRTADDETPEKWRWNGFLVNQDL